MSWLSCILRHLPKFEVFFFIYRFLGRLQKKGGYSSIFTLNYY